METMNLRRATVSVVVAVAASVLLYAVLAFLTDAPAVLDALRSYPTEIFVLALVLAGVSFVVRGVRWGLLMRVVGHPIGMRDAVYLQLSGQTMSVTPGRLGEVLKPWLASRISDIRMTPGVALVFSERLADLIAVAVLSISGLSLLGGNQWILLTVLGLVAAGTGVASSQWFHDIALRFIARQEWARQHQASASAVSHTVKASLTWRTTLWSVACSVIAWGLEGVGFFFCLNALGFNDLNIFAAVSVYAVSTIVGAFTFLPGGIGLTEASMTGILVAAGMDPASASAATLITRVATLWWGVAVGWVAIASRPSLFRSLREAASQGEHVGS